MYIKIKKLDERAVLPSYATPGSAGMDIYALTEDDIILEPGGRATVDTGLSMEIPEGTAALIYARSGLAIKHGIVPSNCVGVIDSDYRGEVKVGLINQSDKSYVIKPGERIAQMVITPVIKAELNEAEELGDTLRGNGGFGSTGQK